MPAAKQQEPETAKKGKRPTTRKITLKTPKTITEPIPDKVICHISAERILSEGSDAGRLLHTQGRFGTPAENGRIHLSLLEALYLLEKQKIEIYDRHGKAVSADTLMSKRGKNNKDIWVRYQVFKDLRVRGYIVKTALKFGAEFRVYDRGIKPGEDHARWVVYPVHESQAMTWHEFSAKNRVAHSTKKRLLIAVVDDELDVTYWEIRWLRP